jgi:hypothetical protein
MKTDIDIHAVTELHLYIVNDYGIYNSWLLPTYRNYEKKLGRGSFDFDLAVAGMARNVCAHAAKRYHAEFGSPGKWNSVFPMAVRLECGRELVAEMLAELRAGNSFLGGA